MNNKCLELIEGERQHIVDVLHCIRRKRTIKGVRDEIDYHLSQYKPLLIFSFEENGVIK